MDPHPFEGHQGTRGAAQDAKYGPGPALPRDPSMGIEGDFPMTRTQTRVLVVGLVVMASVGLALFGGWIPGIQPGSSAPSTVVIDGQTYFDEAVSLPAPFLFANTTVPQSFHFHNVTFWFWVTNWYSVSGAELHGNGTELNGTAQAFTLGLPEQPGENNTTYLSPDRVFGVSWEGSLFYENLVQIFVRV